MAVMDHHKSINVIIMFWFYLVSYFKINDIKSNKLVQSPIDKSDTHFKILFLKWKPKF